MVSAPRGLSPSQGSHPDQSPFSKSACLSLEANRFSSGRTRNSWVGLSPSVSAECLPGHLLLYSVSETQKQFRRTMWWPLLPFYKTLFGSIQPLCHISPQLRASEASLRLPSPGQPWLHLHESRAPHQRAGGRHLWPPVPQEAAGGWGGEAEPVCCCPGGQDLSLRASSAPEQPSGD